MSQLLKIFYVGIAISFRIDSDIECCSDPYWPLGWIICRIAFFGAGAVLVEIVCYRGFRLIIAMNWDTKQHVGESALLKRFSIWLRCRAGNGCLLAFAMRKSDQHAPPVHSSHPFPSGIVLCGPTSVPEHFLSLLEYHPFLKCWVYCYRKKRFYMYLLQE